MGTRNLKQPPIQVQFNNIEEIRMGSPYNGCDVELIGNYNIELPLATWQDRYAWSSDFRILVLIKWDLDENVAGFRFFTINIESEMTQESKKILGLVNNIFIEGQKIKINKFLFDKEKAAMGISCSVEEEYNLPV